MTAELLGAGHAVNVVSIDGDETIALRLLPPTGRVARGAGRSYFFYAASTAEPYCCYRDLSGALLVELRGFPDLPTADKWVVGDVGRRQRRPGSKRGRR